MSNVFTRFTFRLISALVIAFGAHILLLNWLEKPLFNNMIITSYLVNGVLAIAIFGFLYKKRERFKDQIGFLFLAGSLLKFAVFFIVFYPTFKADGNMSGMEFASFFVPYVLCLVTETFSLVKWLNKME